MAMVEHPSPPRHLLLGKAALENVPAHLARTQAEIEQWRDVSAAADFPE
jgi:hypothetical protein